MSQEYVDLKGRAIPLTQLDADERRLVRHLQDRARRHPDWGMFDHYWMKTLAAFYDARGLSRRQSSRTAAFRIAQDLSGRLAIAAGMARPPDYRDELDEIIRTGFPSRRAFCEATGLSEDMLSHVLSGRKNLAIETLVQALDRIGYVLRIAPHPSRTSCGSARAS